MTNKDSLEVDSMIEWKKLVLFHFPAGIRMAGALLTKLILIGLWIIFARFTFWPVIKYTTSLVVDMPSTVSGAKAAMFISLVIGFVTVFAGICICFCRYLDSR
jgi:hypothetical protein